MSDQSGMSAMTERGALDMAIATLQSRVAERDTEIERLRAAILSLLEMPDVCNKDEDVLENVRRRKAALDLIGAERVARVDR